MRCPYCNYEESKVVDSRPSEDNSSIRRRRECMVCGQRFTTYEKLESSPIMVVKKDGTRQFFDREKVKSGIVRACIKRPVSIDTIDKIIDEIESEILNISSKEMTTKEVGENILTRLRNIDEIAYIRFASVYKDFKDIESFLKEIEIFK